MASDQPVVRGGRPAPQGTEPDDAELERMAKREVAERRAAAQRRSDLRRLSADAAFRRFVSRLLEDAQAFTRSWDTSDTRLIQEGRAMLAMDVFNELQAINPEAVAKIILGRLPRHAEPEQADE